MSETPQTDKLHNARHETDPLSAYYLMRDLARQLEVEREDALNAWRMSSVCRRLAEERDNLDDQISAAMMVIRGLERERDEAKSETVRTREFMDHGFKVAAEEATELRQQRDRLAEACRLLMKIIGPKETIVWATDKEIDYAYNAGGEALAAVKGTKQ